MKWKKVLKINKSFTVQDECIFVTLRTIASTYFSFIWHNQHIVLIFCVELQLFIQGNQFLGIWILHNVYFVPCLTLVFTFVDKMCIANKINLKKKRVNVRNIKLLFSIYTLLGIKCALAIHHLKLNLNYFVAVLHPKHFKNEWTLVLQVSVNNIDTHTVNVWHHTPYCGNFHLMSIDLIARRKQT